MTQEEVDKNVHVDKKNNTFGIGIDLSPKVESERKFTKKLNEYHDYLKAGDIALENKNYTKAIENYEMAEKYAVSNGGIAVAVACLANVYEKKGNYAKALFYLKKQEKGEDFRLYGYNERLQYLEFAKNGDYENALLHAKKAMENSANHFTRVRKTPRKDYVERYDDIVNSKEYIESLKK
jgi:tetratricopeptide (TPR) repeat protein